VTADVPAGSGNRRCDRRVYFERSGTPKDRYRQLETGEYAMEAPKTDPRAIFEHTFCRQIAAADPEISAEHLGQPALGDAIPSGIGQFRPFFEINHEIDRNPGVTRPSGVGRLGPITNEVACHFCSVSEEIGYQSC
jgi:hypothetical protein